MLTNSSVLKIIHHFCLPAYKKYNKIWEELIAYFPTKWHVPHIKLCLQQFFIAVGMFIPSCYLVTIGEYIETDHGHTPTIILLFLRVSVATGTCLPSRCLAIKGGIHVTEPLPSNGRRDINTDTQTDGRDLWSMPLWWAWVPWYTYQVLIKTGSGTLKLRGEGFTDTTVLSLLFKTFSDLWALTSLSYTIMNYTAHHNSSFAADN